MLKTCPGGFNGLVCADGWGILEASVACRERNYAGAVAAARIALPDDMSISLINVQERWYFNPRTIWLESVSCADHDGKELNRLQVTAKLCIHIFCPSVHLSARLPIRSSIRPSTCLSYRKQPGSSNGNISVGHPSGFQKVDFQQRNKASYFGPKFRCFSFH